MKQGFFERGGLWVAGQTVLMIGVVGLSLLYHAKNWNLSVLSLGIGCLVVGAGIGIAGAWALGRSLTPFPQPLPQAQLVRHGIYARLRHPLYTSVMFASVGWALAWHSWPALLGACFLIPFFAAKARREERWLQDRFPDYASYAKATWRFFPWVY
jgi:protein-S-isoprenylcysteine O-methyltransferase Ste14